MKTGATPSPSAFLSKPSSRSAARSTRAAAFEAQGVNLSATGMQLRTAYLPDIGQPLLCRFGSGAQEISAEADVVWRREGARGGEFGIRFTNLDGVSAAALWDMCGVNRGEPNAEAPAAHPGDRPRHARSPAHRRTRLAHEGARSRIDRRRAARRLEPRVLAGRSPARARRRRSRRQAPRAHRSRRRRDRSHARKVPQLVVTLRYDDVSPERRRFGRPRSRGEGQSPRRWAEAGRRWTERAGSAARPRGRRRTSPSASETSDEIEAAKMMRSKFSNAAADLMPKVAELGLARQDDDGAFVSPRRSRRRRRRARLPAPNDIAPADGRASRERQARRSRRRRRGVRRARRTPKRRARAKRDGRSRRNGGPFDRRHRDGPPQVVERRPRAAARPASRAPSLRMQRTSRERAERFDVRHARRGAGQRAALRRDDALHDRTGRRLRPRRSSARRGLRASDAGAWQRFLRPMEAVDDRKRGSDDDGDQVARARSAVRTRQGLARDHAPYEDRRRDHGASTAPAPRRASRSPCPAAARWRAGWRSPVATPRIASVHVSNGSKGSELTFQFKDGVPPYVVRAKGHDLQIALGRFGDSDDSSKDDPKHGATAKKHAPETHHRSKKDSNRRLSRELVAWTTGLRDAEVSATMRSTEGDGRISKPDDRALLKR